MYSLIEIAMFLVRVERTAVPLRLPMVVENLAVLAKQLDEE